MPDGGRLTVRVDAVDWTRPPRSATSKGGRTLRAAERQRHRHGHRRGHAGAALRAVLHDQGTRQGHGARPVDRLRHRATERRLRQRGERARPRRDVRHLSAAGLERLSFAWRGRAPASVQRLSRSYLILRLRTSVITRKHAAERYGMPRRSAGAERLPQTGPIVRPRLSIALAAPCTRPCSLPVAARLTRLDIVGWPKPMPSASGTSASANSGTECVSVAATRPIAVQARPSMNVGLSPSRPTDGPDERPCTTAPSRPKRGEEVAGLRRVEAEAAGDEQRERRLEHGERKPVDEVDHQHAAEARPLQHAPRRSRTACPCRRASRCTVSGSHGQRHHHGDER